MGAPGSVERRLTIVSVRISLLLCGVLAFTGAAGAAETTAAASGDVFPFQVQQTTLDNGMRVVDIPYDSPGTVAYYIVVRTGSRDEVEPGHSGFAHFFEHMMFRGTERFSKDAYNEVLKRMGADSNANTTSDRTAYHIIGPASALETMMDIESDRFKNLKYSEDAFRTEALAVLGEYNKNVSNPVQPMIEKLQDLAYEKHTYKHTTIGFVQDVKAMPGYYDYSLKFFDRFYRPENATLVIVGDARPQQVFTLAKKYFGDWRKGYKPADVPAEPPQKELKQAHLDWPNPTRPYLLLGYHVPGVSKPTVDTAALDLIEQLLFSESAPLYQELVVKNQWVDFVQGGPDVRRDPSLFLVLARAKSEDLVPKVKETIDRYAKELQTQPVDPQRLDRIKSHLRYAFALGLDTPGAIAAQVAEAISLTGDLDSINQRFALYQQVTPADIQRLARETFKSGNETIVTLSHKSDAAAKGTAGGANHD
jgi:zinc protease